MKIQYFGSAAYEGIPAMFCNCESCKRAKQLGGKNLRTRAQALLNDEILLDFGPDTVAHYQRFGFDWGKIKYCLITHNHSDHFYPEDIIMFAEPGYSHDVAKIDFFAAESAYEQIRNVFSSERADPSRGTYTRVSPGDLIQIGDYKVLVLPANHSERTSPVFYAIEDRDGKRLLYAHDTGMFSDEIFEQLKRLGRFDLVSLDCTGALAPTGWEHGHMSLRTDALTKDRLIAEGLADENTKFVATHISHNALFGHDHEELCEEAKKHGFTVGYDGLELQA